jgi:hypothetical protein
MRRSSCWFSARISIGVESGDWFLEWRQAQTRKIDRCLVCEIGTNCFLTVRFATFDADPRTFELECESLRGLTARMLSPRIGSHTPTSREKASSIVGPHCPVPCSEIESLRRTE